MKKNEYIKFITILGLIIGAYLLFISNISLFIKNKENTIISYPNVYKYTYESDSVIQNILTRSNIGMINSNQLNEIINNPALVNLFYRFNPFDSEEETLNYLKSKGEDNINYIKDNVYGLDIYYINLKSGELAFTSDYQNILYSITLPNGYFENLYVDGDIGNDTIEKASERVKKKITDLGILDFEITSIRKAFNSEYDLDYRAVYHVEDSKHNIKVTYEYKEDLIYYLEVGFVK